MTHIQIRLIQRNLNLNPQDLARIARLYSVDTAVILGKMPSEEGIRFGYVLIVLIVRSRRPITVMTRRQSQNFNKSNFQVSQIVNYNEIQ